MDAKSNFARTSSDLPSLLRDPLQQPPLGLDKKGRTRRQLLLATLQVISARGVAGATIQEIAATAGMTGATVYNHFATKEAVVQAVAAWLAETACSRIAASQTSVADGAERMAIGQRRYLQMAEESPAWALVFMNVAQAAPQAFAEQIARYAGADLRLGIAQGAFRVADEAAAMDLVMGVPWQAMHSIATRPTAPGHAMRVTTMLLQALGMAPAKAAEVAARPLPPLPVAGQEPAQEVARDGGRRSAPLTSPRRATRERTRSGRSRAARSWSSGPTRSRA